MAKDTRKPKTTSKTEKKETAQKFCLIRWGRKHIQSIKNKVSRFSWFDTITFCKKFARKIKTYPYLQILQKLRWREVKQWTVWQKTGRAMRFISDSWKTVLFCLFTFFGCYYLLGSLIAEKIDTTTRCRFLVQTNVTNQTAECMAFLIKQEVDEKMWTPNLPLLFPASILDNMPNFQIGVISAARDMSGALKQLQNINDTQKEDLKKAHKLLNYSPYVWLLSKQSSFRLAPSANTQYRKAAKSLSKFNARQDFLAEPADLYKILTIVCRKLKKITAASEDYQREHAGDWFDFKSDDIFYYNHGYAFALWQIGKALSIDYKTTILNAGAYTDWTAFTASLQQAAEYRPLIVRNGTPQSLMTPNHLLVQNYYLMRALAAAEKIQNLLERHPDDNKD